MHRPTVACVALLTSAAAAQVGGELLENRSFETVPILAPGGVDFAWVMPSSLPATTSLIIQGFALPSGAPAPFMPMPATNGIYVGTDGHEFRF